MKVKKKILFVLPSLFGGGAERVIMHLVNNLDRTRYKTHLALGVKSGAYLELIKPDVDIHELGGERARAAIPSLVKLVRRIRPDTVFSTLGMNFAASSGKLFFPKGTRLVLREGNSTTAFLKDIARQNPLRALFYRKIYGRLYGLADAVICQSDFMLDDLSQNVGVSSRNLYRIHNPVDIKGIEQMAAQPEMVFPKEGINILSIGKLHYHKGYDILLKAFANVRKKKPQVSLTILGDGEERKPLEDLARQLGLNGALQMPGFQANPYAFLKQADFFVSSSRYEGFANVIVESLACGTPVVATDCPSANREVLREDLNGWLAENENAESLAETINRAIEEAGKLNRAEIRRDCENRFSLERILPLYEKYL